METNCQFSAGGRQGATGFSIGLKGYVVADMMVHIKKICGMGTQHKYMATKENFGGSGRIQGVGFSMIRSLFCTADSNSGYKNDFGSTIPK